MLDTPTKLRVLVVGAGYVAQHLIAHLKDDFEVAYSHRRRAPPFEVPNVKSVYLDLEDDDAVAPQDVERLDPFPGPEGQRVGLPRVAKNPSGGGVDPHECTFREREVSPFPKLRGDDLYDI